MMENQGDTNSTQRHKKTASIAFFVAAHVLLYGSAFLPVYALLTLNYQLIALLVSLTILQLFVRKNQHFVNFIAKYMHPAQVFNSFQVLDDWKNEDNPQEQQPKPCVYAFHPHSVYALALGCSMNIPQVPEFCNLTGLSTIVIILLPFCGLILKLWGIEPASNSNFKKLLKSGKNVGLYPGGFEEATLTSPKEMRCWISRKGFIKYALEYNYAIRPVIILKEHQSFWTFEPWQKLRMILNKVKLPGVFFWNKTYGFFQPTNIDITVIKGRPICCRQQLNGSKPSSELIDQVHREYIEQLQRLYSKYKSLNGDKPLKLY